MTDFGKNLRNELLYQDVTVKELSRLTKIPYSTLICYMNTTNLPNVENGVKIASTQINSSFSEQQQTAMKVSDNFLS